MSRSFLIVAGELSGDHHAAALMQQIKTLDPSASFHGLGGDLMMQEGLDPLHHARDLAVTGFIEVVKHLSFFRQVMSDVVSCAETERPDAAILIDYPGFNLRLGQKLKAMGIPVFYYIAPQVWAWKEGRVKQMRDFIHRLFAIFPFEERYFSEKGITVDFVGHPILDESDSLIDRDDYLMTCGLDPSKPIVALLPGSRRNEIFRHRWTLLDAVRSIQRELPEAQFLLTGVDSVPEEIYDPFLSALNLRLRLNESRQIMSVADCAITSSGTATLELAYRQTPMVVIYRLARLSYLIGRTLVKTKYISMPNLIMDQDMLPELIQRKAKGEAIASFVLTWLMEPEKASDMRRSLARMKDRLGSPGAAARVAEKIYSDLEGLDGTEA